MTKQQQETLIQILEDLGKLVLNCLDDGTPGTMVVGDDKHVVTVEVYRSKDPHADFEEAAKMGKLNKGVTH